MRLPVFSLITMSIDRQKNHERFNNSNFKATMGYEVWLTELRTTHLNFGRQAGHSSGAIDYLRVHDDAILVTCSHAMKDAIAKQEHREVYNRVFGMEQFIGRYEREVVAREKMRELNIKTIIIEESAHLYNPRKKEEYKDRLLRLCEQLDVQHLVYLGRSW